MVQPPAERSPSQFDTESRRDFPPEVEAFIDSETKIAIQKDGELTDISRQILLDNFDISVPTPSPESRILVDASEDGRYGFLYARNKDICGLVASGAVDMAVVGIDRLVEDEAEDVVDIVASFEEYGVWSIVLASAQKSGINNFAQLRTVATKYPRLTRRFFENERLDVDIVPVTGGTEIYPYLRYEGRQIDAVVDLKASGASLSAHNLSVIGAPIAEVYPLLIKSKFQKEEN